MSRQLKLILFVLAFNIIGFAEGYLLHDMGLQWVLPIILATAVGAVLLSRRICWPRRMILTVWRLRRLAVCLP
jgi:hypothetical protein